MKITREWLQEREACDDGLKLFDEHYPGGEADHNEVLRRLSATEDEEISEFGWWLVSEIGFIDETLELPDGYDGFALYYCGNVKTPKGIWTKFRIRAGGSVEAGGFVEAGRDVIAGGNVAAGEFVRAGGFARAGRSVKVGGFVAAGWSVVAGGSVEAGGNVDAGGHVDAGRSVYVGGSVKAGGSVAAGGSVTAGGEIATGEGYGVSAGRAAPRELWPSQGFIKSKNKPNIIGGHWAGE